MGEARQGGLDVELKKYAVQLVSARSYVSALFDWYRVKEKIGIGVRIAMGACHPLTPAFCNLSRHIINKVYLLLTPGHGLVIDKPH